MAMQMTEEVIELTGARGDRSRDGRRRGARSAREVRRVLRSSRRRPGCTARATRREDAPPVNITDLPRRARLRADRPRLPHPRGRRRRRSLPRRGHPLHVLSDLDRGRLRLARPHHAPDQRDDRGRPARAPQLRRPDDVPHRHRQGVRRLRAARTATRPTWRSELVLNGVDAAWLDDTRQGVARAAGSKPRSPHSTPSCRSSVVGSP